MSRLLIWLLSIWLTTNALENSALYSNKTFKHMENPSPWKSYHQKYNVENVAQKNRDRNKKFYIYDWGQRFWWRWPEINEDAIAYCKKNVYVELNQSKLSATGEPLDLDIGLFNTWHFSLFNALYNRLRRSSRRTLNPDEASIFIVPYDIALDSYLDIRYCVYKIHPRCTNRQQQGLKHHIKHSKYFKRHNGADHIVLWSLHQDHRIPDQVCSEFIPDMCRLCTFTCYLMNYTIPDNRYVSVPYPSSYHWHEGIKNPPWQLANAPYRNYSVVYLGSTKTSDRYGLNTAIRKTVASQCQADPKCTWFQVLHQSVDAGVKSSIFVYSKSVFCLNPPGDDSGRRAVFDSLVAGCIPVIFDFSTLYNQYPWYMSEQMALDISVYIPGQKFVDGKYRLMDILNSISPVIIRKKQAAIEIIAPSLQYALPPLDKLANLTDETLWDPPFEDGVDRAVDGWFARVHNVLNQQSTGIPAPLRSQIEWNTRYSTPRIQIPDIAE